MTKIYLVEDDPAIRELVTYTLTATGYEAEGFENAELFWEALHKNVPQLVLLDIMLPGEDGLSLLKKLRAEEYTQKLPVILLTARGGEYNRVLGLDLGADDYVEKPFGMMELLSRVRALLRRAEPEPSAELLRHKTITMDTKKHTVLADGQDVPLTRKEYEMLHLFLENPGIVFNREQLLRQIWGYDFEGETRTVDVHIRTLRQKLGKAGDLVETVRGFGYRMGDNG